VAKIKNIRQKRPPKKFKIPSSVVQWGIVGVVAVILIVLVVGALTRPPAEPAPVPLLAHAQNDLIAMTRMLGDVTLDSSTHAVLRRQLGASLAGPDSLFAQRRWYDALTALTKMLKGATRPESAAIQTYTAFCQYEADNPDRALRSFRKSLSSSPAGIAPRLQFSVGWMFQSRGFQDSAVAYYSRVRLPEGQNEAQAEHEAAPDSPRLLRAEAANNAGVAYEALKDTAAAKEALREAAALLDTAAYPKPARTIRENLARLTRGK
jgi:tetratricopeptide (TPR) repeat protein